VYFLPILLSVSTTTRFRRIVDDENDSYCFCTYISWQLIVSNAVDTNHPKPIRDASPLIIAPSCSFSAISTSRFCLPLRTILSSLKVSFLQRMHPVWRIAASVASLFGIASFDASVCSAICRTSLRPSWRIFCKKARYHEDLISCVRPEVNYRVEFIMSFFMHND
jgi:hypothetical protein